LFIIKIKIYPSLVVGFFYNKFWNLGFLLAYISLILKTLITVAFKAAHITMV